MLTAANASAERFADLEQGRASFHQERPTRIERLVSLPSPVDIGRAEASFEEGVCKVNL